MTSAAGPIGAAFLPPAHPAVPPPAMQPPMMQAPAMQPPMMQAPAMQPPMMQAPAMQPPMMQAPGGYGPAPSPHQAMGYPPGGPAFPPPQPAKSGTAKWLGGCGLAGCLGLVLAGVVGGALLMFGLVAASDSSSDSPSTPTQSDPGIASDLPNHGSVRGLIRSQVGAYSLLTTAPVTKYPERLTAGIVDSIGAFYAAPDGRQVTMMVLGYTSASVARSHIDTVYDVFVSTYGASSTHRQPVRNKQGAVIGALVTITEPGGLQHAYWSNSNVMFIVTGQAPHAIQYHQASPY